MRIMQTGLWQCVSETVNLVQSWSHSQNFKNLVYRNNGIKHVPENICT